MSRQITFGIRTILLCGVVSLTMACSLFVSSPFEYVIKVANYGSHGVILRDFNVVEIGEDNDGTWGVYPDIPGVADDFERFEHFAGYPHSLPEILVVTWQLAELSDCKEVESYKATPPMEDYDDKIHTRKSGCTWTPIEGKIFHQRIDMAAVRASEPYQRVGERVKDSVKGYVPFARYELVIKFIFNENELIVKTGNTYDAGI